MPLLRLLDRVGWRRCLRSSSLEKPSDEDDDEEVVLADEDRCEYTEDEDLELVRGSMDWMRDLRDIFSDTIEK